MSQLRAIIQQLCTKQNTIKNFNIPKLLTVENGVIEYCTFGDGPPIILIMGYAATLNGWDSRFLKHLAKFHQVVIFNNRNVGRSIFNTNTYTISDLIKDVEQLRTGLDLNKVSIVGLSMGGVIAQEYVLNYPQNVDALILINTLPPGQLFVRPDPETEKFLTNLDQINLITSWKILRLLLPSIWTIPLLAIYQFKPKDSKKIVPKETLLQQQQLILSWNNYSHPENKLNAINIPTLILTGIKDKIVPTKNSAILNKYISGSKLIEIKEGGHIMIFQCPLTIAQLIRNYILLKR